VKFLGHSNAQFKFVDAKNKSLTAHFWSLENVLKFSLKSQQIFLPNHPGTMKPTHPHVYVYREVEEGKKC